MSFAAEDEEGTFRASFHWTGALRGLLFFGGIAALVVVGVLRLEDRRRAEAPAEAPETGGSAPAQPSRSDEGPGEVSVTLVQPLPSARRAKAAPAEAPAAPEASVWRVEGRVLELATLAPLAACRVAFVDGDTGSRQETVTDAEGRFRASLPPLPGRGYLITLAKPGYAGSFEDGTRDVRSLSQDERGALARQTAATVRRPFAFHPSGERTTLPDFYLPRR